MDLVGVITNPQSTMKFNMFYVPVIGMLVLTLRVDFS